MRISMKKVLFAVMVMCVVLGCIGCGKDKKKLSVFLPGEYINEDAVRSFEKKFNVKVVIENFDSNEAMYTKLAAGDSYDVLIPSDYMIERLMREEMLQPLDQSKLTNLPKLCKQVQNMPYDEKNTYSVPYFWGNVGIVYDTRKVTLADLEKENFDILRDTRFKGDIFMYDSERDGFMVAFKQLGYSCNTENEDEINAAYEWLLDLGKTMEPVYVTDEVIDGMMNATKAMGIVYSGDAVMILEENENMAYYVPSCGTNVWVDAMVIPKNAKETELANEFINFMISYEAALANTEEVGYASPVEQVLTEMSEGDYKDNSAYVPRSSDLDEVFHDNEYLRKRLAELWTKVIATSD